MALSLFGKSSAISDADIAGLGLSKVIILYICVGLLFLFTAALFGLSKKVPEGVFHEKPEKAGKAIRLLFLMTVLLSLSFIPVFASYQTSSSGTLETNADALELNRLMYLLAGLLAVIGLLVYVFFAGKKKPEGWGAMQFPQLTLGMLAIFVYVGVEVAIGSNLGELLKQQAFGAYSSSEIAPFIAMYWGSLMIGRWAGGVSALNISDSTKKIWRLVLPLIAWMVVMGFTMLAGYRTAPLSLYFICVLFQMAAFYITNDKPAFTLLVFGILGAAATCIGLFSSGLLSVYAFLSAGLFLSIMWPCIFSLALAGTGKYQSQGSGFLIMMILGGAILPPIQGKLSDMTGIHTSFILPFLGLVYIAWFAWYVRRLLKGQGISFDETA